MHIMTIFKVDSKLVNSCKKKFESFFASKQEYECFIRGSPLEEIVALFSKVCQVEAAATEKA